MTSPSIPADRDPLWAACRHFALEHDHLADFDAKEPLVHFNVQGTKAYFGWGIGRLTNDTFVSVYLWGPNGEYPQHLGLFHDFLLLVAAVMEGLEKRVTSEGNAHAA
jgi:hypothetical protein